MVVATIAIGSRSSVSASSLQLGGFTSSAAVTPSTAAPGQTVSITASVKASKSRRANVDVEVYLGGQKMYQRVWQSQSFTSNKLRTFKTDWVLPSNLPGGQYTVKIGVMSTTWTALYHWNNSAATFTVSAGGPRRDATPVPTVAPTTTAASETTAAPATAAPTTAAPTTAAPTTAAPTTAAPTTAAPTTAAPTTAAPTTAAPTTAAPTTTAAPPTTAAGSSSGSSTSACGLAGAVFCETFDAPAGNGGKTGDLNPLLWGVSRQGDYNPSQNMNNAVADVSMSGCGTTAFVHGNGPDVRICNGKLFEAQNDAHKITSLNTYPKQPFDFTGRTGKVVFDVSADSQGSHAAWPEFVITDKPVPGQQSAPSGGTPPGALNEVGIAFDGCSTTGSTTGVGLFFFMRNGVYQEVEPNGVGCVTKGSLTSLNHFEVRISTTRVEVWGTDPGSTALRQLAFVDLSGNPLTFSKGLVWMNDVHYNARKAIEPCECGTQYNHTFAWDNLGFDGPKTYRDLGYDVPDANVPGAAGESGEQRVNIGYNIGSTPVTWTLPNVSWVQPPAGAQVVMCVYSFTNASVSVSINGKPFVTLDNAAQPYGVTARSIPVPLADVRAGSNTLAIKTSDGSTVVSNISLILVAAAPVP